MSLKLSEGLEAYRAECEEVFSWLPIGQDDFDRRAYRWAEESLGKPAEVVPFIPGTFIPPFSAFMPGQQRALWLLQAMGREGLLCSRRLDDGSLLYEAAP